jgi:hypothetical protein
VIDRNIVSRTGRSAPAQRTGNRTYGTIRPDQSGSPKGEPDPPTFGGQQSADARSINERRQNNGTGQQPADGTVEFFEDTLRIISPESIGRVPPYGVHALQVLQRVLTN